MGSSQTPPHIDSPTREQLRTLVQNRPPIVRELCPAVHEIVVETLPDVVCSVDCDDAGIGYGVVIHAMRRP